ncbi:MAG: hypothetical protein Q7U14_08370 [Lacisediminimonas sp.]|nr:hypothetical protein [Lacisediminimonas sp.]
MNHHSSSIAALLLVLSLFGPQAAHAGTPAGQVTQLSGFVMAVKANGALKVLSPKSVVEAGDTLVSEENTYVRIGLADGRQAVLGPQTRLEFINASTLNLATGQLQVVAAAPPGAGRLTIGAGGTTVDAGSASFNLFYRPDPATALAQRAYAQASLASIASPVQSDAGTELPLWEKVATTFIQQYVPAGGVPPNPGSGVRPPGLYVQVLDGAILLSNAGGTQNFSAGQFGYTPSFTQPPVVLPANPAIMFSPPPTFSSSASGSTGSTAAKSGDIDCEVR